MRTFRRALLGLIAALSLVVSVHACAEGFFDDYEAIDRAAKSVLMLEVFRDGEDEPFATGSGFVAFDSRTLVTNYHVIEDADFVIAYSDEGYAYLASDVLIADEKRDVAILRFLSPTDRTPLTLAPSANQMRGQPVMAIGSPRGLVNTVSTGIVSAIFTEDGVWEIQTSAPISHGSSGGALFDAEGAVIGMTSAMIEDGQNLNFAVHSVEILDLYARGKGLWPVEMSGYAPPTPVPTATPVPTPSPTPKPPPTPRPTPGPRTLKSLGPTRTPTEPPLSHFTQADFDAYAELSVGSSGEAVTALKERLYELGYFKTNTFNAKYTENTAQTVQAFQQMNGLPADGVADPQTQALLFSSYARGKPVPTAAPTRTPRPTKTPRPTATPYAEPACPLKLCGYGNCEFRNGSPYLDVQVMNLSEKTAIDGFTMLYCGTDVYGNDIRPSGDDYEDYDGYDVFHTFNVKVNPKAKRYTGYLDLECFSEAKRIYVAVYKVHTVTGRTIEYDLDDLFFYYWEIE